MGTDNNSKVSQIELVCIIVNFELGSKIVKSAKRHGFSKGIITLGKGSVDSRILEFIGLSDIRKEVVFLIADKDTAYKALEEMNKEFEFDRPNHGIVFTTSIRSIFGLKGVECDNKTSGRRDDYTMYDVITVIVDKGKAEEVISAASAAGSKGATIIDARGASTYETKKLFSIEIEPEKEIVIILSEKEMTDAIVSYIREKLKIDEPGKGIIYIQDANKTYGIRK